MKNLNRIILAILAIILFPNSLLSQVDKEHYIPPFYYNGANANDYGDHYMVLSTSETDTFDVTIRNRAGTYMQVVQVSNATPVKIHLGNRLAAEGIIGDADINTPLNEEGLYLAASKDFFVDIRHLTNIQGMLLTSKGTVGLGNDFWSGHMYTDRGNGSTRARRHQMISVMATENNTQVTFDNPKIQFKGQTQNKFTVTLNAYQSYVIVASASDLASTTEVQDVNGTHITSNKPIAVNSGSWLGGGKNNLQDIGVDQIVPVQIVGKEYVLVRGYGSSYCEKIIIVSTSDSVTNISVNGNYYDKLDSAGQYLVLIDTNYSANNNIYIEADRKIYVYQSIAGSTSDATPGMVFIPQLSCMAANNVDISYANQIGNPVLNLITQVGSVVTINGDTVPSPDTVPGNTDWETYSVTDLVNYTPGSDWNFKVQSTGALNAELTVESGAIGAGGYFSGFGQTPPVTEAPDVGYGDACIPNNASLTASGYMSYKWYLEGVEIEGYTDSLFLPEVSGRYTVRGVTSCGMTKPSPVFAIFPCLNIDSVVVNEDADTAILTVVMATSTFEDVYVDYETVNETAVNGQDFQTAIGTLLLMSGDSIATIKVPIVNDGNNENTETLKVILSNAVYADISSGIGLITINDNDPLPVAGVVSDVSFDEDADSAIVNIGLNMWSGKTVTVNYASTLGTATIIDDYTAVSGMLTFVPGDTIESIYIPIINDNIDEMDETFGINISLPSSAVLGDINSLITIVDEDAAPVISISDVLAVEADSFVFTAVLTNPSVNDISFDYFTEDNTATSADYTGVSLTTATILAGDTSVILPPIFSLDDIIDEMDEEFILRIQNPVNASILVDSAYGVILDDEGAPGIRVNNASGTEGDTIVFSVSIGFPSVSDIDFTYKTIQGTADGFDFEEILISAGGTILAGEYNTSVKIATIEDNEDEVNQDFTIKLLTSVNADISDSLGIGTIIDDDYTPIALNDNSSGEEDMQQTGNVLDNDLEIGDVPIIIISNTAAINGNINILADGSYTYNPDQNYNGMDSLQYTLEDVDGDQSTAWLILTITPGDDLPSAVDDYVSVNEDDTLTGNFMSNDTSLYDAPVSVVFNSDPLDGQLSVNSDGSYEYIPNPDFNGDNTFVYTIEDADGDQSNATVNIMINPLDDMPTAVIDSFTVEYNENSILNILLNDLDPDNGGLTIQSVTSSVNASVNIVNDSVLSYWPNPFYIGEDTLTYVMYDADGDIDSAKIHITVMDIDFIPVAVQDIFAINEDSSLVQNVFSNDTVNGDTPVKVVFNTNAYYGVASVDSSGNINYSPNTNFFGTDSLTYTIEDADGDQSIGNIYITVNPRNDNPVAVKDSFSISYITPTILDVLNNDLDIDNGGIEIQSVSNSINANIVIINDSIISYTPNLYFSGNDTISYVMIDAEGDIDSAEIILVVIDSNFLPVAVNDLYSIDQNTTLSENVTLNDTIIDDLPVVVVSNTGALNGTATITQDGELSYTPNIDFYGIDTITYTLEDADGDQSTADIVIEVIQVIIEDIELYGNTINIYPNPTSGLLKISGYSLLENYVSIYSITGRQIFIECESVSNTEFTIDISHLQSGIYFLSTDDVVHKIIKE